MENGEITVLLQAWNRGDQEAFDQLIPLVNNELERIARFRFGNERNQHTLEPAALVNELYLKMLGEKPNFENRASFFGAVAKRMRQILIDHARIKYANKRGGDRTFIPMEKAGDQGSGGETIAVDLLALDEALTRLAKRDPRKAQLVNLRYFAGLTIGEIAEMLDISLRTAKREWSMAKALLLHDLDVNE